MTLRDGGASLPRSTPFAGTTDLQDGSAARSAAAVALGTYIGCTPLYGLHRALAGALGSALALDRFTTQIASNLATTGAAPFIFLLEIQVGGRLSYGAWPTLRSLFEAGAWDLVRDLLLGGVFVGAGLAALTGLLTYLTLSSGSLPPALSAVVDRAARRYLRTTCTSWEMAHGKLRMDSLYVGLLRRGVLPQSGVLVDCGCGRGLMLSLLVAAQELRGRSWPPGWPDPPCSLTLYGIEQRPRMVQKAREALGDLATIVSGDLRDSAIPRCDVALLLDVIHLLPRADQDRLLRRLTEAIAPGGLLVLREPDAGGGWKFGAVYGVNRLVRLVQHQGYVFHGRTIDEWRQSLGALGFDVEWEPMNRGTPFSNVMIYARRRMGS